jgi:hypothetical protein
VKRLFFAVLVACLFAVNSLAADPPVTTTSPAPVVSGTVIAPTTPTVMTTTGTAPTRRFGLFSRLRNRMSGPVYSSPVTTTPGTVVTPAPVLTPATPAPGTVVPTPMPMPSGTPMPVETSSTGSGVVTAGAVVNGMPMAGVVVPCGGMPGAVMSSPMMPMTAPKMMAMETTTITRTRGGLLSRLRLRR